MECVFCEDPKVNNRIIYQNNCVKALLTVTPIVPGHILIMPIRHLKYWEDLTAEEKINLEEVRIKMKNVLKKAFHAQGFNFAWNEELIGGQSVPHLHLHVVPRKKDDAGIYDYEPRKFLYRPGSRNVSPDEELLEVVKILKENLV